MFGGIDPSKIQGMMKKLGIKQEEIDASRVVIEKNDGSKIIIEAPSVSKINMQGNDSWQITGETREEQGDEGIKEEDIASVIEKTGAAREKAEKALKDANGDLAEAILSLS
ncbi:Nascent polypeptide-associated complex protein [Candidatus Pacearchaeota archaeon]|nr:Nascent polypeptide-associated complex protein [Candidatus Pacearchaeota archaeon]